MNKKYYEKIGETLYSYEHPTGLKVYMVSKPGFSKFSACFSTHFGSIDNTFVPIGETEMETVPDGVAHFLEHKVFEQEDGGNVFEMFAAGGASANAYTSFNMTNYYFWSTSNYEKNLETLIKFVQAPYFTKENVEKEQGIIGQEIGMYDDNPGWKCYFNMLRTMYEAHPVRVDIAGTVESISKINEKTLYKCYNTFYHPSNMYMCIVGDFEPEKMAEVIDRSLKPLQKEAEIPRKYPSEPDGCKQHYVEFNLPVSAPQFCIGFKDPGCGESVDRTRRRVAMDIALKVILGKSSKCFNELYEGKLINGDIGFDYTFEEPEYAFAEVSGESDSYEEVGKKILDALTRAEFTEEDFKAAKNKLYGSLISTLDDSEDYMQCMVRHVTSGTDMFGVFEAARTITSDEVRKVCSEIFKYENYVMSVVKNK